MIIVIDSVTPHTRKATLHKVQIPAVLNFSNMADDVMRPNYDILHALLAVISKFAIKGARYTRSSRLDEG